MGRKCGVDGCLSDSSRPEDTGVTFHKVPMHSDIRPKWISLCRIPDDKRTSKVIYICSRHFLRVDFCNFKGKKYMLRQGVLPSVFPWDKSKLEAIKVSKKEQPDKEAAVNVKEEPSSSEVHDSLKDFSSDGISNGGKLEIKQEQQDKTPPADLLLTGGSPSTTPPLPAASTVKNEEVKEELKDLKRKPSTPTTNSSIGGSGPVGFAINSRIEALDFNNTWYPARIVEEDYEENEVLIHFEKYSSKYDEWISMDSPRLRPLQQPQIPLTALSPQASVAAANALSQILSPSASPSAVTAPLTPLINVPATKKQLDQFTVGERCLASWSDARKFPATVTKVLPNDSYEVLFDDGFVKNLKAHRMCKSQGRPMQSSPLFDPIQSTKEERREKKRKIDIAALFGKKPRLENSSSGNVANEPSEKPSSKGSSGGGNNNGHAASSGGVFPHQYHHQQQPQQQQQQQQQPSITDTSNLSPDEIFEPWVPQWENGKPVGKEANIDTVDGTRKSYIVPDPRLPPGWAKHLSQRMHGASAGKWDTIIISPDNKRFRSRSEIKAYVEDNGLMKYNPTMFDFSVHRNRTKRIDPVVEHHHHHHHGRTSNSNAASSTNSIAAEESSADPSNRTESVQEEEAENINYLKIPIVNDVYQCPIDGCAKTYRKENLAQMHVKHYHPEYTKFLDSTPNVADLAYARTVGESLDKSPTVVNNKKSQNSTANNNNNSNSTSLTKTSSHHRHSAASKSRVESPLTAELPEKSGSGGGVAKSSSKDSEIIKLLQTKPYNSMEAAAAAAAVAGLGSGSSSSSGGGGGGAVPQLPHPDMKPGDLLYRSSESVMAAQQQQQQQLQQSGNGAGRDEVAGSSGRASSSGSRPGGIKTLLPVVRPENRTAQDPASSNSTSANFDPHHSSSSSYYKNSKSSSSRQRHGHSSGGGNKRSSSALVDSQQYYHHHHQQQVVDVYSTKGNHSNNTNNNSGGKVNLGSHGNNNGNNNNDPSLDRDGNSHNNTTSTSHNNNNMPSSLQQPDVLSQQHQQLSITPNNNIIIEGGQVIKIVRMKQEEIINCTCGFPEEDGLMIQCDLCLCWQHAFCNNIERESQVPEKYICFICQNPVRQRPSKKYFHDQDWLKSGALATGTYHSRDEDGLNKRFEKLKKAHDISGGIYELKDFVNTLRVKLSIAENKDHPKLYLWSKPWEKLPLPEKAASESQHQQQQRDNDDVKKVKNESENDLESSDSMLMMILKGNCKADADDKTENLGPSAPRIPEPEAPIETADCRLNLLEHVAHAQSLVEERLDDFEKQIEAMEEESSSSSGGCHDDPEDAETYPRTRHTLDMLLRDLDTLQEFSQITIA